MRRQGFSLAEISMAIGVSLVVSTAVATAGSYMMKQSKFQSVVEHGKALNQAMDRYLQDSPGMNWVKTTVNATFESALKPYLANQTSPVTFVNPVSGTTVYPTLLSVGSGASFTQAAYYGPAGAWYTYRGQVIYTYLNFPASSNNFFDLWNGSTMQRFGKWAFQVLDDNGYPILTEGR